MPHSIEMAANARQSLGTWLGIIETYSMKAIHLLKDSP